MMDFIWRINKFNEENDRLISAGDPEIGRVIAVRSVGDYYAIISSSPFGYRDRAEEIIMTFWNRIAQDSSHYDRDKHLLDMISGEFYSDTLANLSRVNYHGFFTNPVPGIIRDNYFLTIRPTRRAIHAYHVTKMQPKIEIISNRDT